MSQTYSMRNNTIDVIDITKFIMSIVIVAIHSQLGGDWQSSPIFPWARIAVPTFFILSSYLFFRKYTIVSKEEKRRRLTIFIKRNLQLYFFWLFVLLIPTVILRDYLKRGIMYGLLLIMRGFLFGSTFVASWYIMADVIAVIIITIVMRRLSNRSMFVIFTPCYCYSVLCSNYRNLLSEEFKVPFAAGIDFELLGVPYNNYVVALFWILVGKIIAESEMQIRETYNKIENRIVILLQLLLGSMLLYIEQSIITTYHLAYTNDCYFALPLIVIPLVIILLNTDIHFSNASTLRSISTITYCLHGTLAKIIKTTLSILGLTNAGIIVFIFTLIACWSTSFAILHFESFDHLKFLKYSH